MRTNIYLLVFFAFGLFSCTSSKKIEQTPINLQPEWVKSRPSSPTFYYGIGVARKGVDINQYQQAARQNALADLASDISVSISSNSLIYAFETNLNFKEDFSSTIRAQAQQDLEGYELVESWEDMNNYWVFYRLSKTQHQQLTDLRKSNAVSRSVDFFSGAMEAREAGNVRASLVLLLKALEPIKPYFSEPLSVDFKGSKIFLGNEIFKELSSTIRGIEIKPVKNEISIKYGKGVPSDILQFGVRYQSFDALNDLPLTVNYSEKPIRNNRKRTNAMGLAPFEIDIVRSGKQFETFSASLDLEDLLAEAGTDPVSRKLVTKLSMPQGSIRINIQKPVFAIIAREQNLGESITPGLLEEGFRKKAVEMGYLITSEAKEADYIVRITASATQKEDLGQYKNATVGGVIQVESVEGNQIYYKPIDGFNGRHFELKQAGEEAFREARKRLENTYFREIHETISKK